jgi:ferric-dicitrate binding protein FerR (iron transport regulator)
MMEGEDRYAHGAARVLRGGLVPNAREWGDDQRDAVVAAMAVAIAAKARRRRIVLASGVALAAAASVVVYVSVTGHRDTGTVAKRVDDVLRVEHAYGLGNYLLRGAGSQPLPELAALAVGDAVRSDATSSSQLGFGNGTRIALAPSSRLRVDALGKTRRFSLLTGRLQAHVAKLANGERFIVDTPGSEVEVRGTVFTVNVAGPSSACRRETTTVEVSEGAVWVKAQDNQVVLRPGQRWAVPCAEPAGTPAPQPGAAAETPSVPAATESAQPAVAAGRSVARKLAPRVAARSLDTAAAAPPAPLAPPAESPRAEQPPLPVPVSRLAEQNDLLSAAMSAERLGQHDLALRRLDLLIERFPSSPLLETARAERQRILSASR